MLSENEIPSELSEKGVSRRFLNAFAGRVFVGYDWIADEEADFLDSTFEGREVSVFRFGTGPWPEEVRVGQQPYSDAISSIGLGVYGGFLITDMTERFLLIFNARNIYVYIGPDIEKLEKCVDDDADIERKYVSQIGDLSLEFPSTRAIYEHYRPYHVTVV